MMSKSQSNLKIISLDSEEEDSENEGSTPTERDGVDSPEVLTWSHSEEIPHQSRLCGDKNSEDCRTSEEEKQSQAIALPNYTSRTPAVSRPWGESKDNIEQLNTWQDRHTWKTQDTQSNEGNYHKRGHNAQVSRPEHCTLQFHFDKGQTRCYKNNRTLSDKVADLKFEYSKDAGDSRNAHFNCREDECECLQIEIVGEESCAKKYLAKLQQLRQEIWNGRFDLHKIDHEDHEASDVALMAHGLEKEFVTRAEKCLSCGILVEKGSRRIKHFLSSSSSHWDDDQLDNKSEIVRSMSYGCQESTDKLTIRNSTLRVVNTDITQYQAKFLVNFFDKKSGLSTRGVIFKNFMKHGGNKLFQYLQSAYSNTESVMMTESSGGLQCQYVCHVALPEYQGEASLQELRQVVLECFNWCRTLEMYDIAFPFLGVGKMLNYPTDRVTKLLISESISQVEQGSDWKISFVLFEKENYSIFMQQLGLQQQKYHSGGSFNAPFMSHSEPDLRRKMFTPKSAQRGKGDDRGWSSTTDIIVPDIQLYTISRHAGETVRRELSRMIKEEYCHEQVFEKVQIGEFSKEKKERMYTAGQNHEVFVLLDKDKNCVLLKGKAKNVSRAAREIGTLVSSESSKKSAATGSRENYHQRGTTQSAATGSREKHHQRSTTQSAATGSREQRHQRGTTQSAAKVRRENHYQRGTPQYWKEMLEEHPVPQYWKYFQDGKSFTDVIKSVFTTTEKHYDVDPETFNAISKLVKETFDSRLVGQGADAKNLRHRGIHVRKVEIIENLDLFKDYNMHRMRILLRSLKGRFPHKVEEIPKRPHIQNVVEKGAIFTEKIISKRLKKDIIPELNEVYLFHGTKKEFVKNIMSKGLDPKCCSDDGMFGRGIYCSESSTKADQYADDKNQRGTEGRMFLMRLLLGHVYITESPKKFKQPPCSNCRQDSCVDPSHLRYDSVVGVKQQSGGLFREFVVYEKNQCYPEYLITYTRL